MSDPIHASLDLATRLRLLRNLLKVAQGDLAKRAGCHGNTVSGIERGDVKSPRQRTIPAIADALGVREVSLENNLEFIREIARIAGLHVVIEPAPYSMVAPPDTNPVRAMKSATDEDWIRRIVVEELDRLRASEAA